MYSCVRNIFQDKLYKSCNLPSSLNSAASSLADVRPNLNTLLETFSLSTDEALCESLIRLILASSNDSRFRCNITS